MVIPNPAPAPASASVGNGYTYNLNAPNPFSFLSSSSSKKATHPSAPNFTQEKKAIPRAHLTATQSKDSSYTYVHMHSARHAELFEEFCKDKLPDDDIYVSPQHQPVNPEDEDDVVPDQHAAFGITRALGTGGNKKGAAWKDLGLAELMGRGPGASGGAGVNGAANGGANGGGGRGMGGSRVGGGTGASAYRGLPR